MKKITFRASLLALALFALSSNAQEKNPPQRFGKSFITKSNVCGTVEYENALQDKNPKRNSDAEFEKWLAPKVAQIKRAELQKDGQGTNAVVTIPVVFHIIHDGDVVGENENLSEARILSQIQVLNEDFRKAAGTPGASTNPAGADMEIEFCMAKQTPNGLPTNGIVRYSIGNESGYTMEEVEILKPQTQWDPEKYLNVWVVNQIIVSGGILSGYAQFPTESGLEGLEGQTDTANTDGIALSANYVGSEDYAPDGEYDPNRNMGRVASHEIGHFFGLRHIWGDGNECGSTDYCDDTPYSLTATNGCPTGIDSCPDFPDNDMIENYMDYTFDECLNTFTNDQKTRMQAVLANSPRRNSLTTANSCTPGTASLNNEGALFIIPFDTYCANTANPVIVLANQGSNDITSAVINYQLDNNAPVPFNWTGTLAPNSDVRIELPMVAVQTGSHNYKVTLQSVNGTNDAIAENNVKNNTFAYYPVPFENRFETEKVVFTLQTDEKASDITWMLLADDGNMLGFGYGYEDTPGGISESHEFDVAGNTCYSFLILDTSQDGMPGGFYSLETEEGDVILVGEGDDFEFYDSADFAVNLVLGNKTFAEDKVILFPNPASATINIVSNETSRPESYTVYNSIGQVMDTGSITAASQAIDTARYAAGVYFVKVTRGTEAKTMQFIKQ